jgi:hypothetical protein
MNCRKISGLLFLAVLIQGCATDQTGKKLDEALRQEPVTLKRQDVRREVTEWINGSSILSPDEKSKLATLREATVLQDGVLQVRSLKLRSILIKDVFSGDYDPAEVSLVQEELKSVEHERLSVFFGAVRDANRILGRWGSRNERQSEQFYDDMMREMGPPGLYF